MSPSPAIPHINESKMKLYEMFAQKQMAPPPNLTRPVTNAGGSSTQNLFSYQNAFQTTDLFTTKVEQMLIELDRLVKQSANLPFALLPPHHDIILVMRQIPLLINQSAQPNLLRSVVEKVVYRLYQSTTYLAIEVYCRFLQTLLELSNNLAKETLSWILYSDDERKYNVWVITSLIRYGLIPLDEYDIQLSKQLKREHDENSRLIDFVTELLSKCLLGLQPITTLEDHVLVINALLKLEVPKAEQLIKDLKEQTTEVYKKSNPKNDTFTQRLLLAEWTRLCNHKMTSSSLLKRFAERILQVTACDVERLCFFFRLGTETCINLYRPSRPHSIDAYARLVGCMIAIQDNSASKLTMISHVLSIGVLVLAHHYEVRGLQFNQKPFLKLFSSLFIELNNATVKDKEVNSDFIIIYSNILYTLQPKQLPGFAFSWLQLFSHRLFLPLLLAKENQENGWTICFKLICAHLTFVNLILKDNGNHGKRLGHSEKAYYQGTLRFLVVMLHDYPEFLCEHYFSFIQLLPLDCIQLRNVILSSFPRTMILPDPFTATLGSMATNTLPPEVNIENLFKNTDDEDSLCLTGLDEYLVSDSNQSDKSIGNEMTEYLGDLVKNDTRDEFDIKKIQRLIFYVATKVKVDTTKSLSENTAIQIYKHLLSQMTTSHDRYVVFSSIADHLRYPNSHTYFFSMTMLHLFTTQSEAIKEVIIRVLLERLVVNRPHPWGLLTTFIQLVKEPHFIEHGFIKASIDSSPDLKRLFESVLKSTQ